MPQTFMKYQETLKRDEQLEKKRREFVENQQQGSSGSADGSAGGIKLGMLAELDRCVKVTLSLNHLV